GKRVKYRSSAFSMVNQATPDIVVPRGLELRMGQCPYQLNHHSLHRHYRLFDLHNDPFGPLSPFGSFGASVWYGDKKSTSK
ncbi:hypothetical protein Dimus_037049, partial [Dionaea muscipula]